MLRRFGVALLGVHGAIHLLGTAVYWRLAEPEGLSYQSELLGVLQLGGRGAAVYGAAWLLAALLIGWAAAALHRRSASWRAIAAVGLGVSLAVTVLAWPAAGWGAVLDVLLLPALLVRPVAGRGRLGAGLPT